MDSNRFDIPDSVRETLRGLNPSERGIFAGVLYFLDDDSWRDRQKFPFATAEETETVWAVAHNGLTVAFVEEVDDSMTIVHVSPRSRFRPSL